MAGIEKKLLLKETKARLEGGDVFFAKFEKVKVDKLAELRRSVKKVSGRGYVVKNTIAQLALEEMGMPNASKEVKGQSFLVTAPKDPQLVSKELINFAKEQESFEIQGVYIAGSFQPKSYVEALALLPSRHQLLASVVGGMKAPITNFVFGLNCLLRNLVVVLDQVSKKKSEQ
jgi:large subunit ribosomal protein L10